MNEHDLTAAYAADAVTPDERVRAEQHLAGCAACRRELAVVREGLAALAGAVPVQPPAHLRATVLARLDEVPQLPPLRAPEAVVVDLDARRRSRPRRALVALAAAAAAVVLLGGGALGWTAVQYRADRDQARAVAADLGRVVSAPDAVTVAASSGADEQWAGTRLVVSVQQRTAVLLDTGADPAPDGRTYQLWLLRDGRPVPAATFDAEADDPAVLREDMAGVTGVAVTVEPEGGSTEPTTEPVALYPMA